MRINYGGTLPSYMTFTVTASSWAGTATFHGHSCVSTISNSIQHTQNLPILILCDGYLDLADFHGAQLLECAN